MTHPSLCVLGTAAALGAMSFSGAAAAASPQDAVSATNAARPALLSRLVACREIADSSSRLACYDSAAGALDAAEREGEVVVVDREQISTARRQLFGFSVPAMPALFDRGEQPEQIDSIESALTRASQNQQGRWVFTLEDGSVWRQIDTERVRFRNRDNPPVRVRRGTFGSYLLTVGDSRAVRVHRE